MFTTAQKHDLLIQFNNYRDEEHTKYIAGKTMRKEDEIKTGTITSKPVTDYNKLYKKLGTDNRNKDVRRQLQDEVDMYTDNQLSTNMNQNMMPGYTMDKHNQISYFKDTFKGEQEEPVDKIYFRQKDELNQFAEARCKALIILRSNKAAGPVVPDKKWEN